MILITLPLMEPLKKHTIPTTMSSQKKKHKYCSITSTDCRLVRKKLDKLHNLAQKILENKDMDVEDKIELLYVIETQFTFTGQDKIPVNDIEARFMKEKKVNFRIAYNIQSAVDYDTKLICAINVTQTLQTITNYLQSQKEQYKTYKKHQNT